MSARSYLTQERRSGDVVQVVRNAFRGRELIDVRVYYRDGKGELAPTKRGVSFDVTDLPRLRAALERAEKDALRERLLDVPDYEVADLAVPAELSGPQ